MRFWEIIADDNTREKFLGIMYGGDLHHDREQLDLEARVLQNALRRVEIERERAEASETRADAWKTRHQAQPCGSSLDP